MADKTNQELDRFVELITLVDSCAVGNPIQPEQLRPYLNGHMKMQTVHKGNYLIHAFQPLSKIVLVVNGEFYLTRDSNSGLSSMVARVWAPEFLGIPQLVSKDDIFYSNIIASEDCLVINIDCDFFSAGMHARPEIALCCVNCMSKSLQRSYKQIEHMAFFDASENLMGYIYRKWVEAGAKQQTLCITEQHTIIANELNVTVRTICRVLNKLKERNMLTTDPRGWIYVSPQQMQRIQQAYR